MNKNKVILVLVLMFGFIGSSFAAVTTLDDLLNNYYNTSSGWVTTLYPAALKLYWFWVVTEMGYQIAVKKVLAGDHQKLWYFVLVRMFTATAFAQIFVNPAFYAGVIEYFVKLGSAAGHFPVTPSSGNPFGSMSPSVIIQYGTDTWNNTHTFLQNLPDLSSSITIGIPLILVVIGVYVLVGIMALTLFMTALESYIVMNAGVILLGFAGSSWTMGFWNKYLSYVGGIAIRLFVMCLILGLIQVQMTKDMGSMELATSAYLQAATPENGVALLGVIIKFFVDMLVCAFLVIKVPSMAGSMLTGTVNSGLGDVIAGASMMLAGAGIAAGLSKMGINMAGGGGGDNAAKDSLKNSLRGDGGGGMPKTSSGGSSSGGQMTPSQQAKQANSESARNEAIGEKVKGGGSDSGTSSSSGESNVSDAGNGSGGSTSALGGSSGSTGSSNGSSPTKGSTYGDNSSSSANAGSNSSPNSSNVNNGSAGSTGSRNESSSTKGSTSGDNSGSSANTGSNSSPNSSSDSNGGSVDSSSNSNSGASASPSGGGSGSIGGNSSASGAPKSNNASEEQKSKAIKDSLNRNKDKLGRNFNKVNQDHHAGGAEVNVGGLHKE